MNRAALLALVLCLMILLMGCPYESTVPIGAPGPGSLDARLSGHWTSTDSKDGKVTKIDFAPFNKTEYHVEAREQDQPTDVERYRVYTVKIGERLFLNINEIKTEAKPGPYYLAEYSFSKSGELSMRFVSDTVVPKSLQSDPKGLVNYLEKHPTGIFDPDDQPLLLERSKEKKR
ncbi:MAG: hypothetical protein PHX83_08045 [Acidobacteriia bacterium]|nr:hypothetical protein [Terriglobia bacterium]